MQSNSTQQINEGISKGRARWLYLFFVKTYLIDNKIRITESSVQKRLDKKNPIQRPLKKDRLFICVSIFGKISFGNYYPRFKEYLYPNYKKYMIKDNNLIFFSNYSSERKYLEIFVPKIKTLNNLLI